MKKIMTTAFIIATIAMGAQNAKMKKACIKMEKDENGTVTKIDTCVTAATDEELQQKINALGLGELLEMPGEPPLPPIPPVPPVSGEDAKEVTMTKVIILDDGEEGTQQRKNAGSRKMKVVSTSDKPGEEAEVIVMDEDGHMMKTRSGSDANVEVKTLKSGEKMDPEIEKIMKEHGIDMKDGETHKIIIKNNENRDGKENKEVRVFVFNKVEVKKLSAEDKKQLPADASKAIERSNPFAGLSVAPNPTEDACTISFKPTSKEPLQINVYDTNGKTVYNEMDKNVSEQMTKTLSLKELGRGIYFVHLTQGKQSEVRKVIVK